MSEHAPFHDERMGIAGLFKFASKSTLRCPCIQVDPVSSRHTGDWMVEIVGARFACDGSTREKAIELAKAIVRHWLNPTLAEFEFEILEVQPADFGGKQ
jgi:hypothetical protein